MSLSDKEVETDSSVAQRLHYAKAYLKEDVKEFIKELLDMCEKVAKSGRPLKYDWFISQIKQLAGDELI